VLRLRALAAIAGRCWRRTRAICARLVEARPDTTLAELQAELERRLGVVAALSTIHNALRRIGLRLRKSR
jgi:transposase